MNQILSKLHTRRDFYLLVFFLFLIFLLLRYAAFPYFGWASGKPFSEFATDFLDKLVISLIVTVFIGSFVFMITPDSVLKSKVEEVAPREIGAYLEDALQSSNVWWYSGGCGRHFRTKTLPEMAKHARNRSLTREVTGMILDPSNASLCEQYANYRRGVKSGTNENTWTIKRVRQELIATIVKTSIVKKQEPLLRLRLCLLNSFSSVRFDLSSEYILLTKEDKSAPAIRLDAGTYFYQWYRDELVLAESQSRPAPVMPDIASVSLTTKSDVQSCLPLLGIESGYFNDSELGAIVASIQANKSPYE